MHWPMSTDERRAAPDACAPERLLGRYRLERELGSGGHGTVWVAYDETLAREVAVKAIVREPGAGRWTGEREARVAARLNHPGIVAVYELFGDEHAVYLVSELVRGRTLADLERAGALADRDIAEIGASLCEALAHAHARGVIHRDVKPENVIVVDDDRIAAKLTDFGVAHLVDDDSLTRNGGLVGTLAYMAPEQAEGSAVGPAADVYSLALTLYECWSGDNPLRTAAAAAGPPRARLRRLPPLRSHRRDLPPELCETVDLALDRRPSRRPSLAAVREVLDDVADDLSAEGGLAEGGLAEAAPARAEFDRRAGWLATGDGARSARAGAAVLAFAACAGALTLVVPSTSVSPFVPAAAVALLVAAAPRAGWLAAAAALVTWLAIPATGLAGTALVLGVALATTPLLLASAAGLWSAAAIAPLAGAAGLACAYIGVAGLAATVVRRAALGAAGAIWLVACERVSGKTLLFGRPPGAASAQAWERSPGAAAHEVLYPLATSARLAPLAVWALFAAILPIFVRGRAPAVDVAGAAIWAVGLVAAHRWLASVGGYPDARGIVAGAILAATVALAVARRRRQRSSAGAGGLP